MVKAFTLCYAGNFKGRDMIKLKADRNGKPLLVFGLSKRNIERLQQGDPIKINLADLGMTGDVFIFAGNTEESMMKELEENGFLPAAKAEGKNPN